jgi:hypothetical protein
VSRLFRDEIGILIGPSRVLLVKIRGGLRPQSVAEQAVTCKPEASGGYGAALERLAEELTAEPWQKANVRVIVSDQWVRYEMLPWSVELSRDSERLAHARYLLAATYGELADSWTVAIGDGPPGAPRLVTAMPTELLTELQVMTSARGLKLVSVQPHAVVAYNSSRHRLPTEPAWFATMHEGSLVAMHVSEGRCDRVRSVRLSDDWEVELYRIRAMARLAQSRPAEGAVFVDAPLHVRILAREGEASVTWLENEQAGVGTLARLATLKEVHV